MPRNLFALIFPVIILIFSWWILSRVPTFSSAEKELLEMAPYLFASVAFSSAYHFKRGRVCLMIFLIILAYYLLTHYLGAGLTTPDAWLVYRALAVLLPFNLLVISIMREKGISGNCARIRFLFLFSQLSVFAITMYIGSQALWNSLTSPILHATFLANLAIPQISIFFLSFALFVILWKIWHQSNPIEGALFGVAIALIVIFSLPERPFVSTIFSSAASLILVFAIIQDSHHMAFRDELTGLPSRRALNELLRGLGSRYAIAMVDVDHFKRFNDNYGHDVGDQVLKVVASRLMAVSGGGRSFRYGGEEFTVVFSGKGAKDALPHLEKLRKSIEDYKMALRSDDRPKDNTIGEKSRMKRKPVQEASVTVSIGVVESGTRFSSPEEAIKGADAALYKAKNGGRNQVCLSK